MVEPWFALTLASVSCFVGFGWFALSINAHWQQVIETGSAPNEQVRRMLRILGTFGLLVSAVLCFVADRPSMAVLVWLMLLAVGAFAVAMILTWRPTLLRVLCLGVLSVKKAN